MTFEELVWVLAGASEDKKQALFAGLSERDRRAIAEAWVPLRGQDEPAGDWRTVSSGWSTPVVLCALVADRQTGPPENVYIR